MYNIKMNSLCLGAIVALASGLSHAALVTLNQDIPVRCDSVLCGNMNFSTYQTYEDPAGGGYPALGGVEIEGKFTSVKSFDYHYLQAVTSSNNPRKWAGDGTVVPVPFIDTPPGGYQGDTWDYLAYYDQTEYPSFYDKPGRSVGTLKSLGKKVEINFETWLVCVITEDLGTNASQAKDDKYKLAPLLGWTWGYTAEYVDNGDGVDDEKDIRTTKTQLNTIAAVSASFNTALGQTYGTAPNTDWFKVELGACTNCVPEPGTYGLMGLGVFALGLNRRRGISRI